VSDLVDQADRKTISRKFHNTLVQALTDVCIKAREHCEVDRVVLSGGVFQNAFLLDKLGKKLLDSGFRVYTQSLVPTNDGGLCLGQAVVANAILDRHG
jgi:hydrogenase maturation protein HypF